jgi:hypothetical protein
MNPLPSPGRTWRSAVCRVREAVLVLLMFLFAACGAPTHSRRHVGARSTIPVTGPSGRAPAFHARRVSAVVVPATGGGRTVFRISIKAPQPVGVRGGVLLGYEARLMLTRSAVGCIEDTGPSIVTSAATPPSRHLTIVLDPLQMKGGQWCAGEFRGNLRYYQGHPCPAHGRCHTPPGFHEHSHTVARLTFRVTRRR